MTTIVKFKRAVKEHRRSGPDHKNDWKRELQELLDRHAGKRADGGEATPRTREITEESLKKSFKTLHLELGMTPLPLNVKEKHVSSLVRHWYLVQKKQVNTIANDLSILRKFSGWIGKPGIVKPLAVYLPEVDPRQLVVASAEATSKAWSSKGINVEQKIAQAFILNERFGLILLAQLVYGLTVTEALSLQPWKADTGTGLCIPSGNGSGCQRVRSIPYVIPEQKAIMNWIQQSTKKTQKLGWDRTRRGELTTLKSNSHEYYARMREIGITKGSAGVVGDGLRAEFALNMSSIKGFNRATGHFAGENLPWSEVAVPIAGAGERSGDDLRQVLASYFRAFVRDAAGNVQYVGAAARANRDVDAEAERSPESTGVVVPSQIAESLCNEAPAMALNANGSQAI